MDYRVKRDILNHNVFLCNGQLKPFMINDGQPIKLRYDEVFTCGEPADIPIVYVCEVDSVSVGLKYLIDGYKPVIVNIVDEKFDGLSKDKVEDMRDEVLYLRSNLFKSYFYSGKFFPLRESEILYIKDVLFFRDNTMSITKPFKISVITASAINNPELKDGKFKLKDYELTFDKIGTIFQVGYYMRHDTLIMNGFGCNEKDNNSIEDTIEILNYYIVKYGFIFKNIIFCIQPNGQYNVEIMKKFTTSINTLTELKNKM